MTQLVNLLRMVNKCAVIQSINKKPLIIMASRRGGSTLVSDAVSSQRGSWVSNEPFAVLPTHPNYNLKKRLLFLKEHSQYFSLSSSELERFSRYIAGLLNAKPRLLGGCANTKFPRIIDRVCLKILNAPWMIDWFVDNVDAHVFFFTRHPGSQAVSVIRQNWNFSVKAYFNRPDTLVDIFSEKQIECGKDILKRNNIWEIAILDWIVTTHHGRNTERSEVTRTTYERIILEPEWFVDSVMMARFGFTDVDAMKRVFGKPSGSSRMSTDKSLSAIRHNNRSRLLSLWREEVSKNDILSAQRILDQFDVETYSMFQDTPINKF